jgi:hypothetical protein
VNRLTLPRRVQLKIEDARTHRIEFPVPSAGYGPWVDAERELWRKFVMRYAPACGPQTGSLWVRTHLAVAAELGALYARPELLPQALYDDRLWCHANRLTGLPEDVLRGLSGGDARRSEAVRAARRRAEQEVRAVESRKLLRFAARFAADAPPETEQSTRPKRVTLEDLGAVGAPRRSVD